MATKLENLDLEIAHFNNLKAYIPGYEECCEKTVEKLLQLGILQVSTAFEHALGKMGGHKVVSEDCGDLIKDGIYSDAKLSSVRTSGYGKSYSAPVTKIFNKTGALRVQVYERKQNKFYYFSIPYNAYSHIPKTSNIEIPFELDGTPRKIPARAVYENWWNYGVASFEEMANKG
jgi:hypothetical protein